MLMLFHYNWDICFQVDLAVALVLFPECTKSSIVSVLVLSFDSYYPVTWNGISVHRVFACVVYAYESNF